MLTKPRFLLSLSEKKFIFLTAKITITITMITIIVITMLIITIIMIMKWNLEMVKQQSTRCVPKNKKTRWFSLYLCFLLQMSREFYFFLCFFFKCCNKVYIYIYIQRRLFTLHLTSQNKPSAHTRSLTGAWKFFLGLIL